MAIVNTPFGHMQVYVRADIVKNAGSVLAKAATIATRYASVRRQTAPGAGLPETQVCGLEARSADDC